MITVHLTDILFSKPDAIKQAQTNLKNNGWCFVSLGDKFKKYVNNIAQDVKTFFKSPEEIKQQYQYEYRYGYTHLQTKDTYRLVTGDYVSNDVYECIVGMKKFSLVMDTIMSHLTQILSNNIFGLKTEHKNQLLMYDDVKTGLLDFVQYVPNTLQKYYVTEHVDPGLFSLNVLSDCKGMEFFSAKKKWISMPDNVGVIFCGTFANQFGYPAARHRIVNRGLHRFSIWYEVGLKSQVPEKTLIVKKSHIDDLTDMNKLMTIDVEIEKVYIKSVDDYLDGSIGTYSGVPKKIEQKYSQHMTVNVPISGTVADIKMAIENSTGRPMAKSIYVPPKVNHIPNKNYDDMKIGDTTKWKITLKGYLLPNHHSDPDV
jgi:isopenicillin N synthase-like dioxygenase